MKFKKYLKPFWRTVQSGEQIVQRRRKFGFLSGRRALLPWLNAGKPLGLLHFLIPVAVVLIPTAIVLTQVPSLRLAAFQFSKGALFESKPKPITQSSIPLPLDVQSAIQNLASQQIKQELPKEQIPQVEVATIVTVLPAVPAATTQPSNVPASTSPQPTTESVSVPATAPAPATEVKPPDQPVVAPQNPPVVPGL